MTKRKKINLLKSIESKYPILDKLYEERILNVYINTYMYIEECPVVIEEACDNFFKMELTKEHCKQLSNFFKELAESGLVE